MQRILLHGWGLHTVCAMRSCLGGASRCSTPPYLSKMPSLMFVLNVSFFFLYSLAKTSSLVGSACRCTSAPFSYASQANTVESSIQGEKRTWLLMQNGKGWTHTASWPSRGNRLNASQNYLQHKEFCRDKKWSQVNVPSMNHLRRCCMMASWPNNNIAASATHSWESFPVFLKGFSLMDRVFGS